MEILNSSSSSDDQEAAMEAKMWNLIFGFSDSLVLKCAVELGLADIIQNNKHGDDESMMTLSELASQLPIQPIDPERLYRVMRQLVHLQLFTEEEVDGQVKYGLPPAAAKFLIKSGEKSMVHSTLGILDKDLMSPWYHLKDGLVAAGDDNCTAVEKALGNTLYGYMAENPDKNHLFNEFMACDSRLVTSALVNDSKAVFEGLTSLVDVGGGTGTCVKVISKAFPNIKKCTVYDLPHVIADAPEPSTDPNNIVYMAGNMFKFIPSGDAIFMKWIFHNWDDKECIQILKLCKEAVPRQGGKVIIVDIVLNVKSTHPLTKVRLLQDINMLLFTPGRERTEEEWNKLFHAAGFASYKITQTSAVQSVIEAYPY